MKLLTRVIFAIAGFIGFFSACTDNNSLAYYEINGTISENVSFQPLNKIRVIREGTDYILYSDTSYTDSSGKYHFEFSDYYNKKTAFKIKVEDVDSTLNLGHFVTQEFNVAFSTSDWVTLGTDGEYKGRAIKTQDFTLQLK